jgi:predicted transcriptional regulator
MKLDLSRVDRETALKCWLTYHGISFSELATEFNVDPSFISHIVKGERRSSRIARALIEKGVPADLVEETS